MPVSAAKAAANRLNAQKSTGPRTAEGKAAASRNAVTHGIFCKDLLVGDEDPAKLEAFQHGVCQRMKPRDAVEAQVVEQYLHCAWRLKRLRRTELWLYQDKVQVLKQQMGPQAGTDQRPPADQVVFRALQKNPDSLEKLARYEHRMFSTMLRCMKELRLLQQEEIEDTEEVENEAIASSDLSVQSEATEACAESKPKPEPALPKVLEMPITSKAARMIAAVDSALKQSVQVQQISTPLSR